MVCWEGIFFSFFRLRRAWSRKLFLLLLPPSWGRGWGLRGAGGFSLGLFVLLLWAVDVRGDSSPHQRVPASQEVGVPLCVLGLQLGLSRSWMPVKRLGLECDCKAIWGCRVRVYCALGPRECVCVPACACAWAFSRAWPGISNQLQIKGSCQLPVLFP